MDRILRGFAFYEAKPSMETLARNIDGLLDRTYAIGEGRLIPAEIIEQAKKGVRAFVVIQPFGCLPNQVTGKTFVPTLKRRLGDVQILTVDYDADTSMANVENRLQMLIMAAQSR